MTDAELVELYLIRSEQAIAATQQIYGSYCRAIAWNVLADEQDVEECLGDIWLKVWNAIPPQRPDHFKGWLAAVARNCAITLARSRARTPAQAGEAALELAVVLTGGPEENMEAQDLGRAISSFLTAQPRPVRMAFLRRYWYGDTVEETARHMGWTIGKTKTVLFRTRNKLKQYLEREELYHG